MQNKHKVVFIGGQKLGSNIFDIFLKNKNIEVGLIFEMKLDDHEVQDYTSIYDKLSTKDKSSKYHTCKLLNKNDILKIKKYNPDFIFVINWRTIFSNEILDIPKYGSIGIHSSDLPKYRGFAPINWAIINGEKKLGLSVFYLDKEVDNGDIIAKKFIKIKRDDDINMVIKKVEKKYIKIFKNLLSDLSSIVGEAQVGIPTYTCKRKPLDSYIDFDKLNSNEIHNLIRALVYPYPMAFFNYQGKKIFINKAKLITDKQYIGIIPGRIISINKSTGSVSVLCKDGYAIEILEVADNDNENFLKPSAILKFSDTLNSKG